MVWSLTESQTSWNVKSSGPWKASLQTKLVEVMEFQLSYFKSWKMMLWKCCTRYASKFGKLSSGHRRLEKVSFYSNPKERQCQRMLKLPHKIALISHTSKVMLKILQARLQQYMNRELPDVQAGFRKGRGSTDQIANICWIIKKQKSSRKTSTLALLTMPKPLTVWTTTNCGKFLKRWDYRTTLLASWETCMQVKK